MVSIALLPHPAFRRPSRALRFFRPAIGNLESAVLPTLSLQISKLKFQILLLALLSAGPLFAQDITAREAPPEIPFDEWIAEAKRVDLPWSIHISAPRLSILQRMVVEFRVEVPSRAQIGRAHV